MNIIENILESLAFTYLRGQLQLGYVAYVFFLYLDQKNLIRKHLWHRFYSCRN
jgi:secreted Zn-dependent insulinase-like peptidase